MTFLSLSKATASNTGFKTKVVNYELLGKQLLLFSSPVKIIVVGQDAGLEKSLKEDYDEIYVVETKEAALEVLKGNNRIKDPVLALIGCKDTFDKKWVEEFASVLKYYDQTIKIVVLNNTGDPEVGKWEKKQWTNSKSSIDCVVDKLKLGELNINGILTVIQKVLQAGSPISCVTAIGLLVGAFGFTVVAVLVEDIIASADMPHNIYERIRGLIEQSKDIAQQNPRKAKKLLDKAKKLAEDILPYDYSNISVPERMHRVALRKDALRRIEEASSPLRKKEFVERRIYGDNLCFYGRNRSISVQYYLHEFIIIHAGNKFENIRLFCN